MPAKRDQVAYYRIFAGEELLFSGVSLLVFSRAYHNIRKAAWFPSRPTHITIDWYDTDDEAALAQEASVDAEKPLFWAGGGTSWIRSGDGYADTATLSTRSPRAGRNKAPDGYYRGADGLLHSRRQKGSGHRFAPGHDPAEDEASELRARVRQLEARLAKLDVCITPGCGGAITSYDRKMCARCYNRVYRQEQAERAVRQRREAEARRRQGLLRGRPEVYGRWVMQCILEDLESPRKG